MNIRDRICVEAEKWIDTPFHHQARKIGVGVDCIGVVVGVGVKLGLVLPSADRSDYARDPFNRTLETEVAKNMDKIAEPTKGCVILMRFGVETQHCAFYLGDDMMLHAYQKQGRVVKHRYNSVWRGMSTAFYDFKGLSNGN